MFSMITVTSRHTSVPNRFKKVDEAPASLKITLSPGPDFPGEHFVDTLWVMPDSAVPGWQEGQFPIPSYSVDSLQVRRKNVLACLL